jgi:hypothetical protein
MTLPASDRTVAAYMIAIGRRIEAAETLALEGSASGASDVVREIAELALLAIEDNRERLGLGIIDRAGILSLVPVRSSHQSLPVSEYLVDIESAVLRYKAHRPGLRSPDAAPKVLSHLLEILSAAAACK